MIAAMRAPEHSTAGPSQLRRWLPLAVLLLGLAVFFALGGERYASFEMLSQRRGELMQFVAAHALVAPFCYVLAYVAMAAFSLPGGAVMTVLGGFLFGPYLGTAYAAGGATLGASIVFLVARSAFGAVLAAKAGPSLHKLEVGFRRNALSYLLVLRLVPLFPFWLVNLVPAILNVPLGTYVGATCLGIIPGCFVFALLGSGIGAVLDAGGKPDLGVIFHGRVILALSGLALLALLPVAYTRGSDFSPAERPPAASIVHWERWDPAGTA